jgi:2-oxoglutarate ferredoxin oxidoreductase subunit alpha
VVKMAIHIKIGAMAGEGAFVIGRTLGKTFLRGNYYVHGYPEYPSLIRTGHNAYSLIIDEKPVYAPRIGIDILIALGKDGVFFHKDALNDDAIIIYDKTLVNIEEFQIKESVRKLAFPVLQILKECNAPVLMKNVAFVSSCLAAIDYEKDILIDIIKEEFKRKGEEVIKLNTLVAEKSYDFVKKEGIKVSKTIKPREKNEKNIYVTGNEAIILGALAAGLSFYAAYPMTPSSSALAYITEIGEKHKVIVIQPEDEIAVINMAAGASFAGLRAMCGTSGGGFALMTETVSMLGMAEIPLVILVSQRVGPSTGMPTWTEQGDLFQILGAGQGEFARAIIAPGTAEQAYYDTAEAFNIAEKYQVPVFILSDKFLSESAFTIKKPGKVKIERGKIINEESMLKELQQFERFPRYNLSDDGISYRTIPGIKNGQHVTTSYEHDEDSFTTENFEKRAKQVEKRAKKFDLLRKESFPPDLYVSNGNGKKFEPLLCCWGSQINVLLDAQKMLDEEGINVDILHFRWLYPLSEEKIKSVIKDRKLIMFENNKTGLFSQLLRMETGIKPLSLVTKYNGRQFFPEQIVNLVKDILKNGLKDYYALNDEVEKYEFFTPWRYGL